MTLTTVLPSLRRSIPDPLDRRTWPEGTRATTTDVVVAGLSLLHLVELNGTPCSVSGWSTEPSPRRVRITVYVFRVTAVDDGCLAVTAPAAIGELLWCEARLIGRASTVHDRPASVRFGSGTALLDLPGDVGAGDLVAVPGT